MKGNNMLKRKKIGSLIVISGPSGSGNGTIIKELLKKNDLRVVLTFFEKNNEAEAGYMELVPTKLDKLTDQITFEGVFETDDYITNKKFKDIIFKSIETGYKRINDIPNDQWEICELYYIFVFQKIE